MSIHREDLDQERIDFGDVASGERFPPIAPGEILRTEFLEPMEISVYALAKAIKVTRSRINDIVLGRRAISADTALRLARYFSTTPEFWVNLQSAYDLVHSPRRSCARGWCAISGEDASTDFCS